jgi:inorganic pyrophosphatase
MNEKAQELNADEREGLAKLLAMDINDMRDTHIEAIKARQLYLTDAEKARFPFLTDPKPTAKVSKKSTEVVSKDSEQN